MSEDINAVAVMDKPANTMAPEITSDSVAVPPQIEKATHFDSYVLTASQRNYLVFKRVADVIISLIALIILAIPFLIIAIIQKSLFSLFKTVSEKTA